MLKLNIISQLLGFFVLAVMLNQLPLTGLLALFAILIAALVLSKTWQFISTIKRFKWFFLVMLIIFAFNTPGEHVHNWPFSISPTYEGLQAWLIQILRTISMLAALTLIIANNNKQQLISGLYFILTPLKWLGLATERFAARLWLTLHYVELQRDTSNYQDQSLLSRLKAMTDLRLAPVTNQHNDVDLSVIELSVPKFTWFDCAFISLLLCAVIKVFI
jgi:energy-coupling factor transporter transmembrane protein EcfT